MLLVQILDIRGKLLYLLIRKTRGRHLRACDAVFYHAEQLRGCRVGQLAFQARTDSARAINAVASRALDVK